MKVPFLDLKPPASGHPHRGAGGPRRHLRQHPLLPRPGRGGFREGLQRHARLPAHARHEQRHLAAAHRLDRRRFRAGGRDHHHAVHLCLQLLGHQLRRRQTGVRRHRRRHLVHQPRGHRQGDHAQDQGHCRRAHLRPAGADGRDHGHREGAQAVRRRGLRAGRRRELQGRSRRQHRRLRHVQLLSHQEPRRLRRGWGRLSRSTRRSWTRRSCCACTARRSATRTPRLASTSAWTGFRARCSTSS